LAFIGEEPGTRFLSVAAAESYFNLPASALLITNETYVCAYPPFSTYPFFVVEVVPTCEPSFLTQQAAYKAAGIQNLHATEALAIAAGAAYDLIDPPPPGVESSFTTQSIPIANSPAGLNCIGWLVFQQWRNANGSGQIRNDGYVFFAELP
jgi:hypothetical protein